MQVTSPRPLRLIMWKPARPPDATDGHAKPDHLKVVGAVLAADHGRAHAQVFVGVIGHAEGFASVERSGEVELIRLNLC